MTDKAIIRAAKGPRDIAVVQQLCLEYRDFLIGFDASMRQLVEHFYPEEYYARLMERLADIHARPRGIMFIAEINGTPAGCGMSQPLSDSDTEIKRVFVREAARGSGAGQALTEALIEQARADGFSRILLDSNAKFTAARRLYEKLGFVSRGPYNDIPAEAKPLMVFYELRL